MVKTGSFILQGHSDRWLAMYACSICHGQFSIEQSSPDWVMPADAINNVYANNLIFYLKTLTNEITPQIHGSIIHYYT